MYFNRSTNLNDGSPKVMLHFAPETELQRKFRSIPGVRYLSADLASPHAMQRIDITAIDWPDASFDIIYCSHVLEHVPDDRRAMSEMFRVLRPGGLVLIQVPFSVARAVEDLSVTDPAERERLFWQSDHVRLYGPDITDRLVAAGFDVNVVFPHEYVQPEDRERMSISAEPLFLCHKFAGQPNHLTGYVHSGAR
jgi:SAM-dependent methyltransferase